MHNEGQSLSDILLRIMPSLGPVFIETEPTVDSVAADSLFRIWKDESNKIDKNTYRRPATLSRYEIDRMKQSDLIRLDGNHIKITDKGAEVIKVMVLGDNSSSFDKHSKIVDYQQALKMSNAKPTKSASLQKQASSNWWSRFE